MCKQVNHYEVCGGLNRIPVNESGNNKLPGVFRRTSDRLNGLASDMVSHVYDVRIARAGVILILAQQTNCLYAVVDLVSKNIIRLSRRFRALNMNTSSIRKMIVNTLVASMLLVPVRVYAVDQGADEANAVPSSDAAATIEERTLGATEGRVMAQESVNALSGEIQELKQSVIALNKNLRVLEEDLLFPANTQVNVFLSLDVGKFFTLESVKLKLDGKVVASHIYTDKELQALAKSGIHKLHMANLSIGEHNLSAFFTGNGPNGRDYKRGTTLVINKENGPKYVELKITDSSLKLQPEFSVREW